MPKFPSFVLNEKLKISIHSAQAMTRNTRLPRSACLYILRKVSPDCVTKSRLADNIGA